MLDPDPDPDSINLDPQHWMEGGMEKGNRMGRGGTEPLEKGEDFPVTYGTGYGGNELLRYWRR